MKRLLALIKKMSAAEQEVPSLREQQLLLLATVHGCYTSMPKLLLLLLLMAVVLQCCVSR